MKIVVIRHGESLADVLNVIEGRADFELTEEGIKQARLMSEYIKDNFEVEKIYSSTLKRAFQTATVLSNLIGVSIIPKEKLMEFNNGKIAGLSREVANILYPKDEDLPFDKSMYGMESLKEFRDRAEDILNEILSESTGINTIVIVSHGGMINRLYRSFKQLDYNIDLSYPTGDTGIHLWEIDGDNRKTIFSNSQIHLKIHN